ncbi:hypothetical protein RUND412_011052 [Rhizina undulata]
MSSNKLSSCCVTGSIHSGEPTGIVDIIHGLNTYIARGDATKGIIVIIPDVFGWELINVRLLADSYAKKTGLTVYLPDFMFGDAIPKEYMQLVVPITGEEMATAEKLKFGLVAYPRMGVWLARHREAVTWPIVNGFFEALFRESNSRKHFVAGFCWGGMYAIRLSQRNKWVLSDGSFKEGGLVHAVYTAHPSLLTIPKDIEAISVPVSFALAGHDERLPVESINQIKATLDKKEGKKKLASEVVAYKDSKHGFATRGNMEIEDAKEAMAKAESQAANWFLKFLG